MSVLRLDEVWEVQGLPVIADLSQDTGASPALDTEEKGGGVANRVAVYREKRFVGLEHERRREMRAVEARIEQKAVDETGRMERLLGYSEDDFAGWKSRIEPHHFNTYCAADFVTLMDDLHAIYRSRQDIIAESFSRQMSLEAERTDQLRTLFKKYHPLLTRAFHKMPAEVEEQLELEVVAIDEMILSNLRQYSEVRFNRLTAEVRNKQKLKNMWKARQDAWRKLNITQAHTRLAAYLEATAVEALVEAPLAELETEMATVWQHYSEHVTGLPDMLLEQVTDESLDQWQDDAYEILNAMSTMFTTHCKSYRKLYLDLENAWYEQLEKVGGDLVSREVADEDTWEALADQHTDAMFGPIRQKVDNIMQESQAHWEKVVKAAPGQVDHLFSYVASSCEVFSLHLAERDRYVKKLELQLQAVDGNQASKEVQLGLKINKSVIAMLEESKVNRVHQLQQTLARTMMNFLPTYEQCQDRRLQLLLAHSERLEVETRLAQEHVADKLEGTVTLAEQPPEQPPEGCHRLLAPCRGVLLTPEELANLQSISAANIGWFLSWERRRLAQDLGDFLLEKLISMKEVFNSKADGLSLRVKEIELTVHDRRSSEIQLHQQRVDSHCRSVAEELTGMQSQLAQEVEWMRARLDEDRTWMAQHELRSRTVSHSYVLETMRTQTSERENRFVDYIVERSGAFRRQVAAFGVELVASTKAFLTQLIPQADPATTVQAPLGMRATSAVSGRADSGRAAVLKGSAKRSGLKGGHSAGGHESAPTQGRTVSAAGHVGAASGSAKRRTSRRTLGQGKGAEEVGNFSNDEIVKYRASLTKLLFTIDATGKQHVKSLEHKMELFCAQLDDSVRKVDTSVTAQIGDVKLYESMQHSYVSVHTLIKSEKRVNQTETQNTRGLIESMTKGLDQYEKKWEVNLKRESQLDVFFRPAATVEWDGRSVGLMSCIAEGTATLDVASEIFVQICGRHRYLYHERLNGTVAFSFSRRSSPTESDLIRHSDEDTSQPPLVAPSSASGLPSVGATVRVDDSGARQLLRGGRSDNPSRAAARRKGSTDSHSKCTAKGEQNGPRGNDGRSAAADSSAVSDDTRDQPGSSDYAADVSNTQETETSAAASASRKTAGSTVTSTAASRASSRRKLAKTPKKGKRSSKEQKPVLSKMEDPQVRETIFGDVDEPDDSDNFVQKIKRKTQTVLEEIKNTALEFYTAKGSRSVLRADLIPATHEEFLELVFARFRAYYQESTGYQLACFAEFCAEFAEFAGQAARIPALLFRHQAALYCRKVAALTRASVQQLEQAQASWRRTAAELDRRLRPALGHPNMHGRLWQLVEHAVSQKEAYAGQLRQLEAAWCAERDALQQAFAGSAAYVARRCETTLLALSAAAHLSDDGLLALRTALMEAVHQASEDCRTSWETERDEARDTWSEALGQTMHDCRKWEATWFSGVETIQQLFLVCEA